MKRWILALSLMAVYGCSDKHSEPNIELVQDMMYGPAVKAQRDDRLPPDGTVPQGWTPYTVADFDSSKSLKNPTSGSKEILARGQKMYLNYCYVCHGTFGEGDGPVAPKMLLAPPTLVEAKIKGWTDGEIFHIITRGRGLMGSYESQIPHPEDRWALVNYVRHLQKNSKK